SCTRDSIVWEESPGFWTEIFFGRRVLFLGALKEGEPRDVYRARVRLTLDGSPIQVLEARNVTEIARR
ncbi:MAG: hypothetical protein U5M50_05480, partial [Sphingobium sp.]|nr:hypothetical protein [Sphingobium sp.]